MKRPENAREVFKFEIPGRLPGLNEVINWASRRNGSWSAWDQEKRKYGDLVAASIYKAGRPARMMTEPVFVELLFVEKDHRRDLDNIAGAAHKIIFDALQETEVIKRDSQRYLIGYDDDFAIDPARPRIEVTVSVISSDK